MEEAPPWTRNFYGWESGVYRSYSGVFRRRADGLSIRVLSTSAVGDPGNSEPEWPASPEPEWIVSFWRRHDSQSYRIIGGDPAVLAEVLEFEDLTVEALLIEMHQRFAMVAWHATEPGFEATGHLDTGGRPPSRPDPNWTELMRMHGWSAVDAVTATKRVGKRIFRLAVEEPDPALDFTPTWWVLQVDAVAGSGLRRMLGGDNAPVPEATLYVSPWHDTDLVLNCIGRAGDKGAPTTSDPSAIARWLEEATDSWVRLSLTQS